MIPVPLISILDDCPDTVCVSDLVDLDGETFLHIRNGCVETGTADLLIDGGE